MVNITTKYLGFDVKNPLIVGSSGLSKSVEKNVEFEEMGAAVVVLKSLFEEQIMFESDYIMDYPDSYNTYQEAIDNIQNFTRSNSVKDYFKLPHDVKKEVHIPVFASINSESFNEWIYIAKDIEKISADALELNIFIMSADLLTSGVEHEKIYFDIIPSIKNKIKIPAVLKIGYYFSRKCSFRRCYSSWFYHCYDFDCWYSGTNGNNSGSERYEGLPDITGNSSFVITGFYGFFWSC